MLKSSKCHLLHSIFLAVLYKLEEGSISRDLTGWLSVWQLKNKILWMSVWKKNMFSNIMIILNFFRYSGTCIYQTTVFCRLLKCFSSFLTNSVDPDQTVPIRIVWSWSTLFVKSLFKHACVSCKWSLRSKFWYYPSSTTIFCVCE